MSALLHWQGRMKDGPRRSRWLLAFVAANTRTFDPDSELCTRFPTAYKRRGTSLALKRDGRINLHVAVGLQPKAVRFAGHGVDAPKSGVCVSGHSMCGAVRIPSNDLRAPATLWYRVPGATGPPAYLPLGPAGLHERPKAGQRG
jgi:hypothetical protein